MPQQLHSQPPTTFIPAHSFPAVPIPPIYSFRGHSDFSTFVAISTPCTHAISTGDDRTVRLWTLDRHAFRGRILAKTPDIGWQCTLSKNAAVAAAACNDGVVRVWRTPTNPTAPPLCLRFPGFDVAYGAALSDNGDVLIATFFNSLTIRGVIVRYRLPSARVDRHWIYSMSWGRASITVSAHCELVALATDTGFFVLDGTTGQRLMSRKILNSPKAFDLALAGDARRVVVASSESLKVYALARNRRDRELEGYFHPLTPSVAISPDAYTIVAAQKDYAFAVWKKPSKSPSFALTGHTELVRGCALSRDSQIVVGAGVDGSVRVWDLHRWSDADAECEQSVETPPPIAPLEQLSAEVTSSRSASPDSDLSLRTNPETPPPPSSQNAVPLTSNPGSVTPAPNGVREISSVEPTVEGSAEHPDQLWNLGRRATEPTAADAPQDEQSTEIVDTSNENDLRRRFSDSRVVRGRGAARGSRLLFAIEKLVRMGIESLGIK